MAKKLFNLSIKDLKDIVGLFDKKKKKRRRRRSSKKTIINNQKSSSDHMVPTNVNNLQSENLHLLNQQLQLKLDNAKTDEVTDVVVANKQNDIEKLQNDMSYMKNIGIGIYNDLYSKSYKKSNLSNIRSKNLDSSNVVRNDLYDDNIDVASTGGDDVFQTMKTNYAGDPEPMKTPVDEIPTPVDEIPPSTPVKSPTPPVKSPQVDEIYKTETSVPVIDNPKIKKSERLKQKQDQIDANQKVIDQNAKIKMNLDNNVQKNKAIYNKLAIDNNIKPDPNVMKAKTLETVKKNIKKIQDQITKK